jgi:hypothetical protein
MAAQHRQARFLAGADDVEGDAGFLADALDEFHAVGGAAAGLGGDRAGQLDVAAAQFVGADLQRPERAVHRLLAQLAGLGQTLAQAHDPAERIDHDEVVAGGPGDQQAAVVGAKVDRGKGAALKWPAAPHL